MLVKHAELAQKVGIPRENIFILENGDLLEIKGNKVKITPHYTSAEYVLVDGLGVGEVGKVVLRDRQVLAQDGMLVIVVLIDNKTGRLMKEPEILSRGFVYVKTSEKLINQIKNKVKEIINQNVNNSQIMNWLPIRSKLRDRLANFIYEQTRRRPMILPVVLTV
jgi:ribonuclease J